jgi:hypothetical protein
MRRPFILLGLVAFSTFSQAQDPAAEDVYQVANCILFGPNNKRAALIEELMASSQYVDKWTMFFGDLLNNNSANTQINRYAMGRDAFYQYIKQSIAADKPYDQMAREIISAQGDNSYDPAQGQLAVRGVPYYWGVQDLFMAILSRNPTSDEIATALKDLQSGARATEAVNLVWQLYNKVDFVFNY